MKKILLFILKILVLISYLLMFIGVLGIFGWGNDDYVTFTERQTYNTFIYCGITGLVLFSIIFFLTPKNRDRDEEE